MIDDQINTFMASDHFRRPAAELELEIRTDIALGKPVNLAAVPDELALGTRWREAADGNVKAVSAVGLWPIGTAVKAAGTRRCRCSLMGGCGGGRIGDAMGHGPGTFKETDLARALRAARKAGADVERIEIGRDGRIVLVLKNGDKVFPERNEWDEWRASN